MLFSLFYLFAVSNGVTASFVTGMPTHMPHTDSGHTHSPKEQAQLAASHGEYEFDLVDETGTPTLDGTGLLLARDTVHDRPFGTVCDDGFTDHTANIICREMGYQCASTWDVTRTGTEYQLSLEIVLDNVNCPVQGPNTTFADCYIDTVHNCGHGEDVTLGCERMCEYEFSLIDNNGEESTNKSGLLVAHKVGTDKYGTVCDDGFYGEAASVVCRSLGFKCASSWHQRHDRPIQQEYDILIDDIVCRDPYGDFTGCGFRTENNCEHEEDIYLTCGCLHDMYEFALLDLEGNISNNGSGLLLASHVGQEGSNGTVCDDSFTSASGDMVCGMLGFQCQVYWTPASGHADQYSTLQEGYDIILDNLVCSEPRKGEEHPHCTYSVEPNCQHSEDIILFCGSGLQCDESAYTFHLVGENGEEAAGGTGLLVAAKSSFEVVKGTVCDDSFNMITAALICQQMGYKCSSGWGHGMRWFDLQSNMDIRLDDIRCEKGAESFEDCEWEDSHNCDHSEDVFLSCDEECSYTFALVDKEGAPTNDGSGLLIARKAGDEPNSGTVCDDGFTGIAAEVVCKEMGFACSTYWNTGVTWEIQDSYPIILDNVQCEDASLNFGNCSFTAVSNCAHREDVHMRCSNVCGAEEIRFKLLGPDSEETRDGNGLLIASTFVADEEIMSGTVCDDLFNDLTGDIICREMGYECSKLRANGQRFDYQESRAIALDNIECDRPTETLPIHNMTFGENCNYSKEHNCGHSEDIFLHCKNNCTEENTHLVFMLVGSTGAPSTTGKGLLLAETPFKMGTVCDDEFDDNAAEVVCKKLGYTCAHSWTQRENWRIQQSYDIAVDIDNMDCETANFTYCSYGSSHNCNHNEDVHLECSNRCLRRDDMRAYLVDKAGDESTDGHGLLIMRSLDNDVAGTVCGRDFSSEAKAAICRSMGYTCANSWYTLPEDSIWLIQEAYDIMMADMSCPSAAASVDQCQYQLPASCSHHMDVFLKCGGERNLARQGVATQIDTLPPGGEGTVMSGKGGGAAWKATDGYTDGMYFGSSGRDGSVTHTTTTGPDAWWKLTWDSPQQIDTIKIYNRADCCGERLNGATITINGEVVATVHYNPGLGQYIYSGLGVETSELLINGGAGDLSLAEVEVFGQGEPSQPCGLQFSLVDEAGSASTDGSGLLLANRPGYDAESAGTVCDDHFSDQSANVICKSMGLQCASQWSYGDRWDLQRTYQILLDDVQCFSSQLDFLNCTYSEEHNCDHQEDIFLTCDNGLEDLGCWSDNDGRAIPSLEGSLPTSDVAPYFRTDPIGDCKAAVIERGWTLFGIQANGYCFSGADAENTYQRYGMSDACLDNGEGGQWANQVYRITEDGLLDLGCWKDTATRAMEFMDYIGKHSALDGEHYDRENPIEKCKLAALDLGYSVFGLKAGACFSGPDAATTYTTFGRASTCEASDLGGSEDAVQVYRIRDDACSAPKPQYKFYFVDEKGNRAEKSGLLIAEGKTGAGDQPGTVCDDMFNSTAATVICREMGYNCSYGWTRKFWEETQKMFPIVLDDIQCWDINTGFSGCTFKTTSNCGHSEDIFLTCDNSCIAPTYNFKLVNHDTGEETGNGKGLLIGTQNGTQSSGTICDDEFDIHSANVICREMEFVCAKDYFLDRPSTEFQNNYDILLDNIVCQNESASFQECQYVTGHNCGHSEDIFLTCKNTLEECSTKELYEFALVDRNLERTSTGAGLLVANRTEEAILGTVCDDRFNQTSADIICKEMGFGCANTYFNSHNWMPQVNLSIVLDNVECGLDARKFSDCNFNNHHDCGHTEDVYLICHNECRGKSFAFYLVDTAGHQTTKGEGLLLVSTLKAQEGWGAHAGTICSNEFNDVAAAVICRQMGFDHASSWSSNNHDGIQMVYPPMLNNVSCTDADTDFTACDYVIDHECGQEEDVYLNCGAQNPTEFMCPPGASYQENSCVACPRNTYKTLYDSNPCLPCEEHSVSTPGSLGCRRCPGSTLIVGGMEQCDCALGQYFELDTGVCTSCPADTYRPDTYQLDCSSCPPGATSDPGSIFCSCPAGQTWLGMTCITCANSMVSAVGSDDCVACPAGVAPLPDQSACVCAAGTFWDGLACRACLANTYSGSGAMACTTCPLYTVSSERASKCDLCEEGYHWVDFTCSQCPAGEFGNKIECMVLTSDDAAFNQAVMSVARDGAGHGSDWLWPLIFAVVMLVVCGVLLLLVLHYRKLARSAQRIQYGVDILSDKDEFMEMSYEPRVTDLGAADHVQLLPAED